TWANRTVKGDSMKAIKGIRLHRHAALLLAAALACVPLAAWTWTGSASDAAAQAPGTPPDGWTAAAPRDEIRPTFAFDPRGGPDGSGCFLIRADLREGLAGFWKKSFPVSGGKHYRFTASYQAKGVAVPRRSVLAELHWRDAKGKKVPLDQPG